jgi:hypothetical protein
MSLVELRLLAKELNIKGSSKLNKTQLTEMLEKHGKPAEPIAVIGQKETVHAVIEPIAEKSKPKKAVKVEEPMKEAEKAPVPLSESAKKARSPSAWNEFLQAYKAEHGCSLKEAMSKKAEYETFKASRK